jgi:hypothetical protein
MKLGIGMAKSTGLPYFPLDCQLDDKMDLIEAEFGLTGFAVILKLFQKIYGGEGYFCFWSNEVQLLVSRQLVIEAKLLRKIVDSAAERGIFHQELYKSCGILTSHGTQQRYLEAASRRKKVSLRKDFLLIPMEELTSNACILN